jgi:peptidoglycan hydrolase CwlO-like protein
MNSSDPCNSTNCQHKKQVNDLCDQLKYTSKSIEWAADEIKKLKEENEKLKQKLQDVEQTLKDVLS